MSSHSVIGLMSGTSLDGLDICHAVFEEKEGRWIYSILAAHCHDYDEGFREELRKLPEASAFDLAAMHARIGRMTAECILDFFDRFPESRYCRLIVSHGQTIFHRPELHFTTQIGCGATIAAITGKPVVSDLRSADVALGGQGAPLVPMGERHLFPGYGQFLNIGGICNIAIHQQHGVTAFDVCPGNTLLNHFARRAGQPYDADGGMAAQGLVHQPLLEALNRLDFCHQAPPKSLGTEHILARWLPLFEGQDISIADALCTITEHIAMQVAAAASSGRMLITGGGALNGHLIRRIRQHCSRTAIEVPDLQTIEYKEALIMGFLGLLRFLGRPNTLPQVTGAAKASIGGALHLPPPA